MQAPYALDRPVKTLKPVIKFSAKFWLCLFFRVHGRRKENRRCEKNDVSENRSVQSHHYSGAYSHWSGVV